MNTLLGLIVGIILVWLAFELLGGLAALILGVILLIFGVKYILRAI